ncbi:MAG: DMT family transporter [Spirochaetia bacterium]|nr:DMT family transporter [Spirochaetia bacterium]
MALPLMGSSGVSPARARWMVACAAVLWSFGSPVAKMTAAHPLALVCYRSLTGTLLLLWILRRRRGVVIWSPFALVGGLAYSLTTLGFFFALRYTTAAHATVLAHTSPLFIAVFGYLFLHERIVPADSAALLLVSSGVLLSMSGGLDVHATIGDLFALGSALAFSVMVIMMKLGGERDSLSLLIIGGATTMLITLPFQFFLPFSLIDCTAGLFLGIAHMAIPFLLYGRALLSLRAVEAAIFKDIEPVLATLWVALTVGEIPDLRSLLGGLLVISALILLSGRSTREVRVLPEEDL